MIPSISRIRNLVLLAVAAACIPAAIKGQPVLTIHPFEKSYRTSTDGSQPSSNSAIEIITRNDSVFVGSGRGLDFTSDGGQSWRHIGSEAPFSNEDIGAACWLGDVIWISLAGSDRIDQNDIPKGMGLAQSTDNGAHWTKFAQSKENDTASVITLQYGINTIRALAITTEYNNITYDLAISPGVIWTANFAGGLRKSTDGGSTFVPVVIPPDHLDSIAPTDTLSFNLSPVDRADMLLSGNLNHRVFSVMTIGDSTVWVGTAGGINLSTDGGSSWRKFTFTNQDHPISGNFVVALGRNEIAGKQYVWAATVNALDSREYRAVSFTSDNGATWTTALRGEFAHNFGFKGEVVYVATNSGVFRSDDAGRTWIRFSQFVDTHNRRYATQETCYAIASQGDTVWVGNSDCLMRTVDNPASFFGTDWNIFRAANEPVTAQSAYVYPNPFAPDDEVARVRYHTDQTGRVSIRVFDFAMFPVRKLIEGAVRTPDTNQDEIWNGRGDDGNLVANGVYYVQVKIGDDDPVWAKVIVLQ
jgi:photosystem II stability/assembly factor-like uncharacterized protein